MALDRQGFANKKEKAVMRALFNESKVRNGICLVTPIDILSEIPYTMELKEEELEPILDTLSIDDYFDYVKTDKNGELLYCITLHKKGLNFQRWQVLFRKSVYFKIFITILFAGVLSPLIKYIVSLITNG